MYPVNFLMKSNLTFDPSFKVELESNIFKVPKTSSLLLLQVWEVKPTYNKICPENLLMRWNFTVGPSFKVKLGLAVFKRPKTC